jgi:hypothetical protein
MLEEVVRGAHAREEKAGGICAHHNASAASDS